MTRHDNLLAFRHMYDHTVEVLAISAGRSRTDLDDDRVFALVSIKLVEIIGEAAARVPPDAQAAHGEIPWRQIVGTRNRLVHGYDAVDFDILWRIVSDELPLLLEKLQVILSEDANRQS